MKLMLILLQIFNFQEGDILFQDCDCGVVCDAIESVTKSKDNRTYSHVGMVVRSNDTLYVLEANSDGVVLTPIKKFVYKYTDQKGNPQIAIGRLIAKKRYLIDSAVSYAMSKLNYEYDPAYLLDNGKYYCSELIYEAFRYANEGKEVFKLFPMNFRDIRTGKIPKVFTDYYKSIDVAIPQGKMGLNPGSMSYNRYLDITYLY